MSQPYYMKDTAYDVFISYSSKDKKVTDALCHFLEEKKIRCWIAPRDLMAGQEYSEAIEHAMSNVKVFILVCSSHSLQSKWVHKETNLAVSDEKIIIPFKIDNCSLEGTGMKLYLNDRHWIDAVPYPNDAFDNLAAAVIAILGPKREEIMHPMQQSNNSRPDKMQNAGNLSLQSDQVKQHQEKKHIHQPRLKFVLASCFIAALLIGGIWLTYDSFRAYTEYYSDYVDQWGMPVGIFPLTKEQIKARQYHYRFLFKGREKLLGKRVLREVIRCNSAGTPIEVSSSDISADPAFPPELGEEIQDHATWQKIEYNTDYTLAYIDLYDAHGIHLQRRVFSGKQQNIIDFKKIDKDDVLIGGFQSSSSASVFGVGLEMLLDPKTDIQRWQIKRDEIGRPKTIMYFRNESAIMPSRNSDGFFGLEYVYDYYGRVIWKYYLDEKKNRMSLKNGIFSVEYEYSPNNSLMNAIIKRDSQGNEIEKKELEFDENNNLTSISYYRFGKISLNDSGYAQCRFKYDEAGYQTECSYHGLQGELKLNNAGIAKEVLINDARGCVIKVTSLGINDKPCLNNDGYATIAWKYDERGNRIEENLFGIDGKPCVSEDGYAKCLIQYDERGKAIEAAYFGADGKPCLFFLGFAKTTMQYDEKGNMVEVNLFGINGNPCSGVFGFAKKTMHYDERGNLTEEALFGVDGKPCASEDGYAKCAFQYDERGNITVFSYFDAYGKPCMFEGGFAGATIQYDELGNINEVAFFGIDGKPCLQLNGFAKTTSKFDEYGNEIETAFFDVDGKPCLCKDGFARITAQYDERGNVIEVLFSGVDGKPCLCVSGYAKITSQYDERGNMIEEAYFGVDGKPCLCKDGFARITVQYDATGEIIDAEIYDLNGNQIEIEETETEE